MGSLKLFKKSIPKITVLAVLMFMHCFLFGQQLINHVEYLNSKDGLSVNAVNVVLVDSYGVVWLGTEDGLNRLVNGKVEVFNSYAEDAKLVGHTITALFEDSKGNIWVGDQVRGITVYNPEKNTWTKALNLDGNANSIENKKVINFVEDDDGCVWAALFPRILICFHSPDSISKVYEDSNFTKDGELNNFFTMAKAFDNGLLLNTPLSGTLKFNKKTKTLSEYREQWLDSTLFPGGPAYNSFLKNYFNKGLIAKKNDAVYYIDFKAKKAKKLLDVKKHEMTSAFVGRDSSITIVHVPYIWEFDKHLNRTSFFKIGGVGGVQSQQPTNHGNMGKDRGGVLWIGTLNGLIKIDPLKQKFSKLKAEHSDEKKSISNNYIRCMSFDSSTNTLWLGARYGKHFDKVNLSNINSLQAPLEIKNNQLSLPNNEVENIGVNSIFNGKDGTTLLTTYSGLFKYKNNKTEYLSDLVKRYPIHSRGIWAIQQLETGDYLIGGKPSFISVLSADLTKITPLEVEVLYGDNWENSLSVWNLGKDSKGNIWVLSSLGLFKVVKLTGKKITLERIKMAKKNSFWSFCVTKNKEVWAGTVESGIFCFDEDGNFIRNITPADGLPSASVLALVSDDYGDVWTSSFSNLSRIRALDTSFAISTFSYQNGISVNDFNHKAVARDGDGNLFFGAKDGVLYFNPKVFNDTPKVNHPYILMHRVESEGLEINGLSLLSNGVTLSPEQRTVLFEPALIDYSNVKQNSYLYYMEGLDDKWFTIKGESPQIQYSQLPPGEYVLHIKGVNSFGIGSKNQLHIPIVVTPLFWETIWFTIVMIVLALALVVLFIYLSLNTSNLQHRLINSEVASLRAQMNPHFFFNALNSIQDFIYHQDKRRAADYMSSFAKLLRIILENSSKKLISLNEEIAFLRLYLELEALRFEGKLNYFVKIGKNVDVANKLIPPMLLQPLIENAIKHGLTPKEDNLQLDIEFEVHENLTKCIIRDNGVGRKVKKGGGNGHTSKGLSIVKERLELINRLYRTLYKFEIIDLENEKGEAKGTEVVIYF